MRERAVRDSRGAVRGLALLLVGGISLFLLVPAFSVQGQGPAYRLLHFCSVTDEACLQAQGTLERAAGDIPTDFHLAEGAPSLMAEYQVSMLPSIVIVGDGEIIGWILGSRSPEALEYEIGNLVAAVEAGQALMSQSALLQASLERPSLPGYALAIDLTYDAGLFTVGGMEIFSGATPKARVLSPESYIVQVRDAAGRVLHARAWHVPRIIAVAPPQGGEAQGDTITRDYAETTLLLPYYPEAESVVVFQPYGVEALTLGVDHRTFVQQPVRAAAAGAEPVYNTGPDDERLVILFIGDKYKAKHQALWGSDVDAHADFLLKTPPFKKKKYRKNINIYRSNTSNKLGCKYGCFGIDRLICCKDAKVFKAAAQSGVVYDEIYVLVNKKKYGGAGDITIGGGGPEGYGRGYSDVQVWGRHVTVHEFGHSWGGLMDEYEYFTEGTPYAPNCDYSPCRSWGRAGPLGCYPGCSYNGLSRPTDNHCLMKTLTPDPGYVFCKVCEGRLKKLNKRY